MPAPRRIPAPTRSTQTTGDPELAGVVDECLTQMGLAPDRAKRLEEVASSTDEPDLGSFSDADGLLQAAVSALNASGSSEAPEQRFAFVTGDQLFTASSDAAGPDEIAKDIAALIRERAPFGAVVFLPGEERAILVAAHLSAPTAARYVTVKRSALRVGDITDEERAIKAGAALRLVLWLASEDAPADEAESTMWATAHAQLADALGS